MEAVDVSIYSDEVELAKTVALDTLTLINSKLRERAKCHVALTGGSLGNQIAENLAKELNKGNWDGLNIWWSDERYVHFESELRNDLIFMKNIDEKCGVEVHRTPHEGDLEKSALHFNLELSKVDFDLIILGVGPDGHVASLFPGQLDVNEARDAFAIKNSPKPPSERITFSMRKINSAKEIWLVASGIAKADVVAELVEGESKLPVGQVSLTRLIVDSLAFGVGE